jgi:hypothetical protein
MVTKRCYRCGKTKPASEFYNNRGHRDGLSAACRPCTLTEAHERWRKKHPEPPPYVAPTEKACTVCGVVKPLDQFHRNKNSRDGRKSDCAACCTAAALKWNNEHPDYHRAKAREYHQRHPGRTADNNLQWRLGVPRGTYDKMLASQGGKCAICGTTDPGPRLKRFHVDHCHTRNQVRGLLCYACNVGLGAFRDKSDLLISASEYILRHIKKYQTT